MKNSLLVLLILISQFFTYCTKKPDTPAPATPIINHSTPKGITANTSGILLDGKITKLSTSDETHGSLYNIVGNTTAESQQSLTASFNNGEPKYSFSQDLSKSTDISLRYSTDETSYYAISGTLNIVVGDTATSIRFTDVTFKDDVSGATIKFSGQLIVSTKPTPVHPHGLFDNGSTGVAYITVTTSEKNGYIITGAGNNDTINFIFPVKPIISSTEELSSSSKITISYKTATGTIYTTNSGTVTIDVDKTNISVAFSNVVFTDPNSENPLTMSVFATTPK